MEQKFRYAYHPVSPQVIYISSASRGLACECICLDCGSSMEAVKGEIRDHYFRHDSKESCSGESAMHRYAKEVIARNSRINLPGGMVDYDDVRIELALDDKRPDVTLAANGSDIYIEIVVTNPINQVKREFYHSNKLRCYEIDLSEPSLRTMPPVKLEAYILQEIHNKHIVEWQEQNINAQQIDFHKRPATHQFGIKILVSFLLLLAFILIKRPKHKKLFR